MAQQKVCSVSSSSAHHSETAVWRDTGIYLMTAANESPPCNLSVSGIDVNITITLLSFNSNGHGFLENDD